jgi:hypothetical protein
MTNLEFIARAVRQHKIDTNKKWVVGLFLFGLGACGLAYFLGKDSKRKGHTIKKQASDLVKANDANRKLNSMYNHVVDENTIQKVEIDGLKRELHLANNKPKEAQEKKPEA